MIGYIINTLEQPYALFPTQKRFSMLPEHFPETFSQFSPPITDSSRSGAWRATDSDSLLRLALQSACGSSRGLRSSQPEMNCDSDHILCHVREKPSYFLEYCEQEKDLQKFLVFNFSKLFIFSERNFKLPSIIQYLLIQNLINKQTC